MIPKELTFLTRHTRIDLIGQRPRIPTGSAPDFLDICGKRVAAETTHLPAFSFEEFQY